MAPRGMTREHRKPEGCHSNEASPPSCSALPAITRKPYPLVIGLRMLGPPASSQVKLRAPSPTAQRRVTVPDDAARAPYLAALVASSCSAKPIVCAILGSRRTSGPSMLIAPGRYGASTWPTSFRRSAPSHLDSE